jgi:LuxR family maltose regulon positive regulatory protein
MQRLLRQVDRGLPAPDPYLGRVLAAFSEGTSGGELMQTTQCARPTPNADLLTGREVEVLRLVDLRLSNREIAWRFGISPETVQKHLARIFARLGVSGRREAASRARQFGVL